MREQEQDVWVPAVLRDAGEDDSEVYVVGVRESLDDDSWSLLFMEFDQSEYEDDDPQDDDPQDIDDGMDTYCLVVDPGQATHYGGVRECELDGQRLRLVLTEQAAQTLGMPVEVSFGLEMSPAQVDVLRRGLARVLTSGRTDALPQQFRV